MSDNPQHDGAMDADVATAVQQAQQPTPLASAEGNAPQASADGVAAVPQTKNQLLLFWWGLKSATVKIGGKVKRHPWHALAMLFISSMTAVYICEYCGALLLGAWMIYGIKNEQY